jgi:hypothetical protein
VYPFLEQDAANMTFKVEDLPYYPFLPFSSFDAIELLYRPTPQP